MRSRITLAVVAVAGLLGVGVFAVPSAASATPTRVTGECYQLDLVVVGSVNLCIPYLGI